MPSVSSRPLSTSSISLGSVMAHTPPPLTRSLPRMPTSLPTRFRPTLPGPMPTQRRTLSSWSRYLMLSHQRTVSTHWRASRARSPARR
ncbi:hypothetical protein VTK73DRAFT_5304 [Phialemonium thermophilum]|uniref:Uncharacterized protein n=1 Tax=Phialemonium thermophilum TaxID=223376 RepID=A0ABR3V285_9PEZI